MASEKLIHVRLEHNEAIQAKKDLLLSQANLIKIMQTISEYKKLRSKETRLKTKLKTKFREALTEIRKLQRELPKLEIPDIIKEDSEEVQELEETIQKKKYNNDLESQLQEIQDKLRNL